MEHRFDFIANILRSIGWVGVALISFTILFQQSAVIAGWNKNEVFVLFGMYMFINESWYVLFSENLINVSELVRLGELDHILLLPVSTQFLVSLQNFFVFSIPNILLSLVIIGYYLHHVAREVSFLQYLISTLLVLNGLCIIYAIMLIAVTVTFWLTQFNAFWALYDLLTEGARYPVGFYKEPLHFIFIFIVPLAVVFTFPAQFLVKSLSWQFVFLSFFAGGLLFVVSHKFFYFGIKHYNSASS